MAVKKYHGIKSLAKIYAEQHNISISQAESLVKSFVHLLEDGIQDKEYEGVQFIDSFTFQRVIKQAKLGRNPKTKEVYHIPQRAGIKLVLGKHLAEKIQKEG